MNVTQAKRRTLRQCWDCAQPLSPHSRWYCEPCLRIRRRKARARKKRLRGLGVCEQCAKPVKVWVSTRLCEPCVLRHRERNR